LVDEFLSDDFDVVVALDVLEYIGNDLFREGLFAEQDGAFGVEIEFYLVYLKNTLMTSQRNL